VTAVAICRVLGLTGDPRTAAANPVTAPAERDRAFERWVIPELPVMFRVALSLTHNHAEAEDLLQDSIIRAYRGIEGFDGTHPRAWLLTIVRNTHINRHRRQRPELLDDPAVAESRSETVAGPEEEVLAAVFDDKVETALHELPIEQQTVINLVDVGGLSYQETAQMLDVPVGTVMSRLHRGRKRIKHKLSGVALPRIEEPEGGRR
jgi:RNA polymerase sigma-70 factor (ECF subfamily)